MEHVDSHGPTAAETPPPWWTVDGAEISLESLETDPLPDGTGPDDIRKLQDLVRLLARENRRLRERLAEELKHRYGRRSEKGAGGKGKPSGDQQNPAADAKSTSPEVEKETSSTTAAGSGESPEPPAKKPGHGRRPIPPDLPRDEVLIPLKDESCKRCHGPVHRLERVESYRYHYVPGHIRVRILVRWRCVCDDPTCDGPFRIAKLPPEPIPKGRATAGLLAHLLVMKFADHCPLYRVRKILLRQKVDLPLSTLVDYCKKSTELLKPLWELMVGQVLLSAIIQTDDTHIRVRLPHKKGVLKGHLWAYKGDEEHPYVVFEFTPDWRGEAPQTFLAKFEGYVQADAYKGYDALFKGDSKKFEVGCWAHARRKWVKARVSSPHVAGEALEMIRQLYAIEAVCQELTPEQRKCVRQDQSAPVLEKLRVWMEDQKARVLPKSAVGEAIEYALNQWAALTRYLEDGRLKIDNNEVEAELRAVALGRKNWMAVGSEIGGETAAIGYTMIASAVACGVEPVEWLTDVLERIVTCPPDRLVELLPDRWKAAHGTQPPASPGEAMDESPGAAVASTNAAASFSDSDSASPATGQPEGESPQASGETRNQEGPIGPPPPRSDRSCDEETPPVAQVPPLPEHGSPACRPAAGVPPISTTPDVSVATPSTATPVIDESRHSPGLADRLASPRRVRAPRPEPLKRPREPRSFLVESGDDSRRRARAPP